MPSIHVVIILKVFDIELFSKIAKTFRDNVRSEEGCIYYDITPSLTSSDSNPQWVIIGKFKSLEASQVHLKSSHHIAFADSLQSFASMELFKTGTDIFDEEVIPMKPSTHKSIRVVVGVSITSGNPEDFRQLSSRQIDASRKEAGVLQYTYCKYSGKEEYMFIEAYEDEDALSLHRKESHTKAYLNDVASFGNVSFFITTPIKHADW